MKKIVKPNFTNRTFDIAGTSDFLTFILPPKDDFFKRKRERENNSERERGRKVYYRYMPSFLFHSFFFVIMTDEFLSAEHPRLERRVKGQRGSGQGTLQLHRSAHSSDTVLPIS